MGNKCVAKKNCKAYILNIDFNIHRVYHCLSNLDFNIQQPKKQN